jgi:hypothetical protein
VRLQLVGLKLPGPSLTKLTVPVGGVGVAELSVTLAVHDVAWFTAIDEGVQLIVVDVELGPLTVTDPLPAPLLVLPWWIVSDGV